MQKNNIIGPHLASIDHNKSVVTASFCGGDDVRSDEGGCQHKRRRNKTAGHGQEGLVVDTGRRDGCRVRGCGGHCLFKGWVPKWQLPTTNYLPLF